MPKMDDVPTHPTVMTMVIDGHVNGYQGCGPAACGLGGGREVGGTPFYTTWKYPFGYGLRYGKGKL